MEAKLDEACIVMSTSSPVFSMMQAKLEKPLFGEDEELGVLFTLVLNHWTPEAKIMKLQ